MRHREPQRPIEAPTTARHRIYHRVRAHSVGGVMLKIVVGLVGTVVIIIGAILIPLPGPGWLIVLAGIAIWAAEFEWARRLLGYTRRRLENWWHWMGRQALWVRLVAGLAGLVFVTLVVWLSVWISFDVNLLDEFRRYVSTR